MLEEHPGLDVFGDAVEQGLGLGADLLFVGAEAVEELVGDDGEVGLD
jgi:hypothetical protein